MNRTKRIFGVAKAKPSLRKTLVKALIDNNGNYGSQKNYSPMISYCTTCYNRFWQLKQVIKHNITIINNHQPAEWIIVDFDGNDSEQIRTWLTENCPRSLANGTLKYYHRTHSEPFVWNVSTAKNVAHRLATGKILVNLDGDNYLQPNDLQIMRNLFRINENLILHQTWNNFLIYNNLCILGRRKEIRYEPFLDQFTGSNGRIALTKENFYQLGGYDEEMLFMGFQDTDLLTRAIYQGLQYIVQPPKVLSKLSRSKSMKTRIGPYKGAQTDESISNERTKPYDNNQVKSWQQAEAHNRHLSAKKIKSGHLVSNQNGFSEPLEYYFRDLNSYIHKNSSLIDS